MTTIYQARTQSVLQLLRVIPGLHRFYIGMEKLVWEGIFHNKVGEKAHAIEMFKNHIDEVKRVVPAERLLVFDVTQGWEPLCSFLNVPAPVNRAYPHRHNGTLLRQFLKYTGLINYH